MYHMLNCHMLAQEQDGLVLLVAEKELGGIASTLPFQQHYITTHLIVSLRGIVSFV